jgi:hypothetical protein
MRLNQTRIAHGQRLDGLAAQTTRDHVRPVRSIIVLNRGVGALLNISRSVHVAFAAKRTCMDATPRPPQSWMTPTDLGQIKIPQRSTFRPFIGPDRLSGSRKADLFRRRDLFEGRCQCRVRPRYFARCLPAPEQAARVSVLHYPQARGALFPDESALHGIQVIDTYRPSDGAAEPSRDIGPH